MRVGVGGRVASAGAVSFSLSLGMTSEEFWQRVDVKGPDECWPWKKGCTGGYGAFKEMGKMVRAHRRALELGGSELKADELACHRCDNRVCCNPAHLFAGTVAINNADCTAKGRASIPHLKGSSHPSAKLTDQQRMALVSDRHSGMSYRSLASKYGISAPSANYICRPDLQTARWERRKLNTPHA